MKVTGAVAAPVGMAVLVCWCGTAEGYRPFDGTDAAVTEQGEVEIELGPAEYLREGAERALFAPNVRLNYGFTPGWEAVLEGEFAHGLTAGTRGTSLVGNGAFLKGILREGSLQEKTGPSIATEFGILLPGTRDEHGAGVGAAGIVSQQWSWATAHFNAAAALTRQQHADYVLDAILEGPRAWTVRPVAEVSYEREVGQLRTRSALVGGIWQVGDNVAVDFAVRVARLNEHTAGEIRAGVTFAFGVTKGPDLSSATALHGSR